MQTEQPEKEIDEAIKHKKPREEKVPESPFRQRLPRRQRRPGRERADGASSGSVLGEAQPARRIKFVAGDGGDPSRRSTFGALRFYRQSRVTKIRYLTPVERWMGVEDLQTAHQQDRQKYDIHPVRRADQHRVPIDQPAAEPIASPLIRRRRRVPNLVQLLRRAAHRSLLAGSRRHIGGFTPSAPITTAAASEPSFFITTKTLRPAAS